MAYTIIVILASNMMKFIPLTGMQKEDPVTIAIWISCFQSVFAWIYFHFHLCAPTCYFEIWSSWLMLLARKSCQWCWQSFFCQLMSVPGHYVPPPRYFWWLIVVRAGMSTPSNLALCASPPSSVTQTPSHLTAHCPTKTLEPGDFCPSSTNIDSSGKRRLYPYLSYLC